VAGLAMLLQVHVVNVLMLVPNGFAPLGVCPDGRLLEEVHVVFRVIFLLRMLSGNIEKNVCVVHLCFFGLRPRQGVRVVL